MDPRVHRYAFYFVFLTCSADLQDENGKKNSDDRNDFGAHQRTRSTLWMATSMVFREGGHVRRGADGHELLLTGMVPGRERTDAKGIVVVKEVVGEGE